MAYALVANTGTGSTDAANVTPTGVNTTGANFVAFGAISYSVSAAPSLVDSKGNVLTALTAYAGSQCRVQLYYCLNPTVGSGHTGTLSRSASYPALFMQAWSGAKSSSPFDAENGASGTSATSLQPGSVTPSEDNELLISVVNNFTSSAHAINSSFTISNSFVFGGGGLSGAMAYRVQTTAGAVNPTWSWSTANTNAAAIACFKIDSVSGLSIPVAMAQYRQRWN